MMPVVIDGLSERIDCDLDTYVRSVKDFLGIE
jgi:hypothetical protein